jgi:hypothetical protein
MGAPIGNKNASKGYGKRSKSRKGRRSFIAHSKTTRGKAEIRAFMSRSNKPKW